MILKTVFKNELAMKRLILPISAALLLGACGDSNDDSNSNGATIEAPDTYSYVSRFDGESSVSYSGQVMRQVLLQELKSHIGGMSEQIDTGAMTPSEGDVLASLDFYFRFDSETAGAESISFNGDTSVSQDSFEDISSDKDLVGKLAGNDAATDHKDWTTEFKGWADDSIAQHGGSTTSPEGLTIAFFQTIDANAVARANGAGDVGPNGESLPVYVTKDGLDLQQLTEKFLLGAINFSQAADDYMDDDVDGKGLLADHSAAEEDKNYTALEHAWDEGWGYFGASQHYNLFTDEELAGKGGRPEFSRGHWDANEDGVLDLKSEYNFGASINAGKRDHGAVDATDFTGDAYEGFSKGRALIAAADGPLNDAQLQELKGYRDLAINAWEQAYAATAVHYVNDTVEAMDAIGTEDYDFVEHAKVWSELKGFALSFQFNPRSPLSDAQFEELHTLIGDRPVHAGDSEEDLAAYRDDLLAARALLGEAYGFSEGNLEGW